MRKPRIFVVEGPDCTGKSSLAKFLANRLNAAYFHAVYKDIGGKAQIAYLTNILDNAGVCLATSGIDVVLDRHWPSECCYGHVMRGGFSEEHAMALGAMMSKLRDMRAIYIYCWDNSALARHESKRDPSHPYLEEAYLALETEYAAHRNCLSAIGNIVHDYSLLQHGTNLDHFLASLNINS